MKAKQGLPISAAIVAGVSVIGVCGTAQAFEFKVSGTVDRAVTAVDNGSKSDIGFVDNDGENSRFRFTGNQELASGANLGFTYEIGMGSNLSSRWDVNKNDHDNKVRVDTRIIAVHYQNQYGTVQFGKMWAASSSAVINDYSGTPALGGGYDYFDYAASLSFVGDNGKPIAHIYDLTDLYGTISRQNGIEYSTPTINGFTVTTGLYDGHAFDINANYETSFGNDGKFTISAAYLDTQNLNTEETPAGVKTGDDKRFQLYGGSAALLLPGGLNFTAVYMQRSNSQPDRTAGNHIARYYFGGAGYKFDKHNFQVNYSQVRDFANKGSKLQQIGLAYVYNWMTGVDLFASYHHYMADHVGVTSNGFGLGYDQAADGGIDHYVDGKDIDQIYAGVRVKFL